MKFMCSVVMMISILNVYFNLEASELSNVGITTSLTSDQVLVNEGQQLLIDFHYQSTDDIASLQNLSGKQVTIDLSDISSDPSTIVYQIDENIFDIQINADGVVTLTVKPLTQEQQSLTSLSGDCYFLVRVKEVNSNTSAKIADTEGHQTKIDIIANPGDVDNTDIFASQDYAQVGDEVNYQMVINGDNCNVGDISVQVIMPEGMTYDPSSVKLLVGGQEEEVQNIFEIAQSDDHQFMLSMNSNIDKQLTLSFDGYVTAPVSEYVVRSNVTYDHHYAEQVSKTVKAIPSVESELTYNHANIHLQNTTENGQKLAGSKFEITDPNGKIVDQLVTDSNGYANSANLAFGTYYIKQTSVNEDYLLNKEPLRVVIPYSQADSTTNVQITNSKAESIEEVKLIVSSVDQDGAPIANTQFTIYDQNQQVVEKIVTDEQGKSSATLPIGKYSIKETSVSDGYQLPTSPTSVVLTSEDDSVSVEVTSQKIISSDDDNYISIHVTTSAGDALAGISFGIYDENGNLIEIVTTDENGNAQSKNLDNGEYYIMQLDEANNQIGDKYWIEVGRREAKVEYVVEMDDEATSNPTTSQEQPAEPVESTDSNKSYENPEVETENDSDTVQEEGDEITSLGTTGNSQSIVITYATVALIVLLIIRYKNQENENL